jgi:hypothetical protein
MQTGTSRDEEAVVAGGSDSCWFDGGAGRNVLIRVRTFPNIAYPQVMVAKANGWFEKVMGPEMKIEIDMAYLGPNPP